LLNDSDSSMTIVLRAIFKIVTRKVYQRTIYVALSRVLMVFAPYRGFSGKTTWIEVQVFAFATLIFNIPFSKYILAVEMSTSLIGV